MNQKNLTHHHESLTNQTPVWTALVTPFTAQGSIDFPCLKQLAHTQADAGNALLLLGSTGEGLALSLAEQKQIVEFVCQLSLNVPLMVAVGGYDLSAQVAWITYCNTLPISAYLLATPIYSKPGPVGQTQWFCELLDTADFPCMLYNVPSRSGVEIPLQTAKNVQDHPNCWAMKEASGDVSTFTRYRDHCPQLALFSGEDALMPELAKAGAKGLVSVCSNVWPDATKRYVELALTNNINTTSGLWKKAIASLFHVANPIPVKILMHEQGTLSSPLLRAPLTHLELAESKTLLAENQHISQWLMQSQRQQNFGV